MKKSALSVEQPASPCWSCPPEVLFSQTGGTSDGLSTAAAKKHLLQFGPNHLKPRRQDSAWSIFLTEFKSPLVLILLFAALVSSIAGEWTDTVIITLIVIAGAVLGFVQEYSASRAVEKLQAQVTLKALVKRDGQAQSIPSQEIVPGDLVLLSAGSLIPADGIILESTDFFVNQAVLTGETFPVEKYAGPVSEQATLSERTNMVFMGTSVRSGTASVFICETGIRTEFGQIAQHLTLRPPETEFERGIRHFGYLLTQIMLVLVTLVLIINTVQNKPVMESLLFAIALAVGIAPELLPAIIGISLARGAQDMARRGVIVRRLNAIENLGSMDILCTDKTGTISEGVVRLQGAYDALGTISARVLHYASINAACQAGLANALDDAILSEARPDLAQLKKLYEIPYDFSRKRLSVIVETPTLEGTRTVLVSKGAFDSILPICTHIQLGQDLVASTPELRKPLEDRFADWSSQGFRVLGVAVRDVVPEPRYTSAQDECELIFMGFLLFFDPPRADARETLDNLLQLGVRVKIITGDNHLVAQHMASVLGLPAESILPGSQLRELHDEALWHLAERTTIFSEVDPNQKERIILALRKMGHVVGFMGDGINDAPALHAADIGISVEHAVDVAKEAADFVLLRHDLGVLLEGIKEGRKTFANTLKYIFTTTSANFGNMVSMAGASLFLPFLPLLAKQVLLNNFLSDFPAAGIPGDHVDAELVNLPHRWNIRFIRNFMITFGLVSSLFDYTTFGLLILIVRATEAQFQTGWFVESLLTELVIALVVRTQRPFFRSRPGKLLLGMTILVSGLTLVIPYTPIGRLFGFTPLPFWIMAAIVLLTCLYILAAEIAKKFFYAHVKL